MKPNNRTSGLGGASGIHPNILSTFSTLQTNTELNFLTNGSTKEGFPNNEGNEDLHNSKYKDGKFFDNEDKAEDSITKGEEEEDLSLYENEGHISPSTDKTCFTDENAEYPSSAKGQGKTSRAKEDPYTAGTRKTNESAEGGEQNPFSETAKISLTNRTSEGLREGVASCREIVPGSMRHVIDTLAKEDNETKVMSVLWPYGNSTGFPLVPYRILIEENAGHLGTNETLDIGLHAYRCLYHFGKRYKQSQKIFIHPSCAKRESVVRGIGISLGLHYEFLRPDRDAYVKMNLENLLKELPVYTNDEIATSRGPYDYSSVMQPHGVWYSKLGKITFATKDIRYQGILGRSKGDISHRDKGPRKQTLRMY
ncbi:uncharacterized protein [Macrobrachium rosenbergii]|uniref:uncharacterized protein isoform X2 n=1 Tax=Macrobrachium rosenbergii TaxID=79674 RepID=UPI0034D6D848